MITADINQLELAEFLGKENPKQHCRATFPILGAHGTEQLATVYFEIESGDHLGRHTDSAEELLVVLDGEGELEINGETTAVSRGSLAIVPAMAPHNIVNTGESKVRVLGVFGANNIVATFEKTWLSMDSSVVDTAQMA